MFILITPPEPAREEAALINRMFAAGLAWLYVRRPGGADRQVGTLLRQIDPSFHSRIILRHEHRKTAGRFGVERIHFTEKDRMGNTPTNAAKRSTSVHSVESFARLSPEFDFAFFGPVFDSISKKGYGGVSRGSVRKLMEIKSLVKKIALGGIDQTNCRQVLEMGFDGLAALGAVWQRPKPVSAFIEINNAIQQAHSLEHSRI